MLGSFKFYGSTILLLGNKNISPEDLCMNFYTASCEVYKNWKQLKCSAGEHASMLCTLSVHKCVWFRIICCGKEAKPLPPPSTETCFYLCRSWRMQTNLEWLTTQQWVLGTKLRTEKQKGRRQEEGGDVGRYCTFLPLWSLFHRLHNVSHFILSTCAGEMAGRWFLWGTGNWAGMPQHPRKNWARYASAAQGWRDGSKQITGALVSQVSWQTARSISAKDSVSEK